jgi:mannose-1-phosphate guanylyltransferase/mannose-1-phosphate guanylyltransferase/mannose-6-phosphate isomerase
MNSENQFDDCIIMAGGSGTRLWPASTSKRPKQFLKAPPESSFFAAAVERALAVTEGSDGRVIIVAGKNHGDLIIEACAALGGRDRERMVLIPEPQGRNTAPAIACALLYSEWASGGAERKVLVITSDHIIKPLKAFAENAAAAAAFAMQDKLVVFGVTPLAPETGYGYIEAGEALSAAADKDLFYKRPGRYEPEAYKAGAFREKPDFRTAVGYIKAGNFYWNSGMFAFSSKFMLNEYRRNAPEVIGPFDKLQDPSEWSYLTKGGLRILSEWQGLDEAYAAAKAISFDYAIAEKCTKTVMVKADFSWTDVGSWDEYARLLKTGEKDVFRIGSENSFVDSDIPVALVDADNLIVVIRSGKDGGPPSALVVKKGETQKVRQVVDKLKETGRTELL